MTKLKPCPFCGKKPYLLARDHEDFPHPWYMVICDYGQGGCGAESAWCVSAEKATEMWNRRAGEDD